MHTHIYIYIRRALTSELHGSPDATTDGRKSVTGRRVACSPPSRRDKQPQRSTTPQRLPFNSPGGLSETHACPARQERAGPPVPGSPLQGKHAEVPSRPPRAPLAAPAGIASAPAQPSALRAAFRPLRPRGTPAGSKRGAARKPKQSFPPPNPPPRRETAPKSHLRLLFGKGRRGEGGRGRTCTNGKGIGLKHFHEFSWSNRGGGGGCTEKLVLQRRKRLSP